MDPAAFLEPWRVIRDLRDLDTLTSGAEGARRVAWAEDWLAARSWLRARLEEVGINSEHDEAGNLWAYLPGETDEVVAIGSHIDSVPHGGWLDGALGVLTALEVMRACKSAGRLRRTVALVDFADEEGARFGHSLFGSSAVAGVLDAPALAHLCDAQGQRLQDVLLECGVHVFDAPSAVARRKPLIAYLELHIEQGPVLERERVPVAAVRGTVGVERHRFVFTGEASHAGTTPMAHRHDAGLAAACFALSVADIAREFGGVGTVGSLRLEPGMPTVVPGQADLVADIRHRDAVTLGQMLTAVRRAAGQNAAEQGCQVSSAAVWRIAPIGFDPELVSAASEAARLAGGRAAPIVSGALHDAAQLAPFVPCVMMFCSSIAGLSHSPREDTAEADLAIAIGAFGSLAWQVIAGATDD